jgi:hypothetical protein
MFRKSVLALVLLVLGMSGAAVALDNNCAQTEEVVPVYAKPPLEELFYGDVFDFPTVADTWEVSSYPFWWHVGDTVYGSYVTTEAISHVDISITLTYNILNSGGHCDFEFRINGTSVGSFIVTEASGLGPVLESFDFTSIPAGAVELRYYETNQVAPGAGSISISEVSGTNSVNFYLTALDRTTWGAIKASL